MLEYWFMIPVGIAFASIAMMTGIGGAILFTPFFLLVLKLDALTALAAGLFIEIFGFSSGIIGYWRLGAIDFSLVRKIALFTLPATIIGVIFGKYIPILFLKLLIIVLLGYLATNTFIDIRRCIPKHPVVTGTKTGVVKRNLSKTHTAILSVGGVLVGMISAGLGEVNEYVFLEKLKLTPTRAAATSVTLVALSAIVGVVVHIAGFIIEQNFSQMILASGIVFFTVPGVIIGAQIGVWLSQKVHMLTMRRFVATLFVILMVLMIWTL